MRNWSRTWPALVVDLGVAPDNSCILTNRRTRTNWIALAAQHPSKYTWMGAVRPGMDEARVLADADMQLADMGQYKKYTNNCYVFTDKMYEVERLL